MFKEYTIYLKGKGIRDETVETYISNIRQWSVRTFNSPEPTIEQIKSYTSMGISKYMTSLNVSDNTKALAINSLRSYYRYLIFTKVIRRDGNVALDIPVPHIQAKEAKYLTQKDGEKFLKIIKNTGSKRDYAIALTFLTQGLRKSELVSLDISNIKAKYLFVEDGKGGKPRKIPLPEETHEALMDYLKTRNDDLDALFVSRHHRRIDKGTVYKMIKGYLKKIKRGDATVHSLRHTICSLFLNNDVNVEYIRYFMGHSSILTTQRYMHKDEDKFHDDIINNNPFKMI